MKKLVKALALVLAILTLTVSVNAFADDDMGVVVLKAPETEEAVSGSQDDMVLKAPVEVKNFGTVTIKSCDVYDALKKMTFSTYDYDVISGADADYLVLNVDILNTQTKDVNYLSDYKVSGKVVFDDVYEYGIWFHQQNYNDKHGEELDRYAADDRQLAVGPMYLGHYMIGCTLPNAVINSDAPLSFHIFFGDTEIVYNVRK